MWKDKAMKFCESSQRNRGETSPENQKWETKSSISTMDVTKVELFELSLFAPPWNSKIPSAKVLATEINIVSEKILFSVEEHEKLLSQQVRFFMQVARIQSCG